MEGWEVEEGCEDCWGVGGLWYMCLVCGWDLKGCDCGVKGDEEVGEGFGGVEVGFYEGLDLGGGEEGGLE